MVNIQVEPEYGIGFTKPKTKTGTWASLQIDEELTERAIELLKEEGKWIQFIMWQKRGGADHKLDRMIEELYKRHGQNLGLEKPADDKDVKKVAEQVGDGEGLTTLAEEMIIKGDKNG